MTDSEAPAQINYQNFYFGILTNRKIPFSFMVVLFIVVVFIIPEIIFFEGIYRVSWTNLFWIEQNYINYFPDWWSVKVPHADLLNTIFIVGSMITIILSKGLYDKAWRLKEKIVKQAEKSKQEEYRKQLDKQLGKCFKKWPWYLIIFELSALPILNFFMLNYGKFLIDPEKTLMMSIESTYSLEIQFFGLAFMVAITFGFGSFLRKASTLIEKKQVNVFHPDRVGGFRIFGEATLRNLVIWTMTYLFIVIVGSENMISIGTAKTTIQLSFYIWNLFLISAGLIVSIIIFLNPLRAVRRIIREVKGMEMDDLIKRYKSNYIPLLEREGDPYNIAAGKESTFLKGEPIFVRAKVRYPTEAEYRELVRHLNVLTWQHYYYNTCAMRDWPWDTSILIKFYFSLLIPIIVTILNVVVMGIL
ncbi:MAG: hypothetical protein ACTSRS_04800 [Candidatus Helarchaeota archaeon]